MAIINPIFVVGNSRSGTTLLARIINKSNKVYVIPHELHFWDELANNLDMTSIVSSHDGLRLASILLNRVAYGYFGGTMRLDSELVAEALCSKISFPCSISQFYISFYEFLADKYQRSKICEQTPRYLLHIDSIFLVWPDARIICMVRDPRAVLVSQKNKWRASSKIGQPLAEVCRAWAQYHPLIVVYLWKKNFDKANIAKEKYGDKFYLLRYEELIDSPKVRMQDICNFLNIEFDVGMTTVSVEMSSNVQHEGQLGLIREVATQWKEDISPEDLYLTQKILRTDLEDQGYQIYNAHPNALYLVKTMVMLPFKAIMLFLLNWNRIGNPLKYLMKVR